MPHTMRQKQIHMYDDRYWTKMPVYVLGKASGAWLCMIMHCRALSFTIVHDNAHIRFCATGNLIMISFCVNSGMHDSARVCVSMH